MKCTCVVLVFFIVSFLVYLFPALFGCWHWSLNQELEFVGTNTVVWMSLELEIWMSLELEIGNVSQYRAAIA